MAKLSALQELSAEERAGERARALETISEIRADPARYTALREALRGKVSDDERAEALVGFITNSTDLAAAQPTEASEEMSTWLTITLTTIFIPTSAY